MRFRNMQFRIALPLISIALNIALFYLGDLQVRTLVAGGGTYEGVQDSAATARYLGYALNAPAWALLGDTRDTLWSPSTYWKGYDAHYLLAVGVMWLLIGLFLDDRFPQTPSKLDRKRLSWHSITAWGCTIYGLFTCYAILPRRHSLSVTLYISTLANAVFSGHGWWWYLLGLAWGLGLMTAGVAWVIASTKRD